MPFFRLTKWIIQNRLPKRAPFTSSSATRGRVSWVEFEVPNKITRGEVSWAEFEVPSLVVGGGLPNATLLVSP